MNFFNGASRYQPQALAILRIFTGLLFMGHGIVKLFGWPEGAQPGQQEIATLLGVGGILETFGGALIVLGLFTRPTAFVLSGMMAVAYWMFHFPSGFLPILNGGEGAILFCFIFLYLVTSGPGTWSLDAARKK